MDKTNIENNLKRIGFDFEKRINLVTLEEEIIRSSILRCHLNDIYKIEFNINFATFEIFSGNGNVRELYFSAISEIETFIKCFKKPRTLL